MKRVMIITSASKIESHVASLADMVDRLSAKTDRLTYEYDVAQKLIFSLNDSGVHIFLSDGRELRDTCDILYLRNMHLIPDYVAALYMYCRAYGITVLNPQDAVAPYFGKVSQGFVFRLHGVPTPDFISAANNKVLAAYIRSIDYRYPCIIKHNNGIKGIDNYLVRSADELTEILEQDRQGYVVQPFFENNGELRVLTFGDTVEPVIFRKQAAEGTHLNNTSRGGLATKLSAKDVPADIMQAARQAARLTGRDIGGVDVLLGTSGSWTILEVNYNPLLAGGALYDEKIDALTEYFETLAQESV